MTNRPDPEAEVARTLNAVDADFAERDRYLDATGELPPRDWTNGIVAPKDRRALVLASFATLLGLPPLVRLTQRGREAETARFTLHLADGRTVRIGTIRILRSQTELAGVLSVAIDIYPPALERKDWHNAISALMTFAKDVEETTGESFTDAVAEWALAYSHHAVTDRDGAARLEQPFRDGGDLYVTANGLARFIRREYSEQIKLPELRQALADLGAERTTVSYEQRVGRRSSRSYYRVALDALKTA